MEGRGAWHNHGMSILQRSTARRPTSRPPAASPLVALPLTCLLLSACAPEGGAVGAIATGHFSARHHFPVIMVSWCGDSPPARIDLSSEEHEWRLTATREFSEQPLEVNLAAPGEDWTITDGSGAPAYRIAPGSPDLEYLLGVTSEAGVEGENENDIASLRFDTETLAGDDGVYVGTHQSDQGSLVDQAAFPPEC